MAITLPWRTLYIRDVTRYCRSLRDIDLAGRQRLADLSLTVVLAESNALMYANKNNPESLRLPHDAVGQDAGSVGLYQQQVGGATNSTADWGTTAELMDPWVSTAKFVAAVLSSGLLNRPLPQVAQAIQNSAIRDGSQYARNVPRAVALRRLWWRGC